MARSAIDACPYAGSFKLQTLRVLADCVEVQKYPLSCAYRVASATAPLETDLNARIDELKDWRSPGREHVFSAMQLWSTNRFLVDP